MGVGFDKSGAYLLTVSHSGRGVFSTSTWERVARDYALAYPKAGTAVGIGPIAGEAIPVAAMDSEHDIGVTNSDRRILLKCSSSGIEVVKLGDDQVRSC